MNQAILKDVFSD